jgi:hypothetical protein
MGHRAGLGVLEESLFPLPGIELRSSVLPPDYAFPAARLFLHYITPMLGTEFSLLDSEFAARLVNILVSLECGSDRNSLTVVSGPRLYICRRCNILYFILLRSPFERKCLWVFRYFVLLRCVEVLFIPDVSKERTFSIFKG